MGRAEREKGKRWEREVASRFREAMPGTHVKRGWQTRSGEDAPDVDCPPFWIECKVGKAPPVLPALEQAERDAPRGRVPIGVVKRDRTRPVVVLGLDDFLEILASAAREWER